MRKKIIRLYVILLAVGIAYTLLITLTDFSMPCAMNRATGYLCPGCGISRMFLAMFRLDFSAAFACNPVAFVLFFFWNLTALMCFIGKPAIFRNKKFLYTCLYISVGVMFLYGILRNFA